MFSKLDTSFSPFTCGWYGEGISPLIILSWSTVANHLCLMMSSDPALRFPYRLERSAVTSFFTRALALRSKYFGK